MRSLIVEKENLAFLLTECATITMTVETGRMNQRTAARRMSAKKTMEDVIIFVLRLQEDSSVAVMKVFSCLGTALVLVSRTMLNIVLILNPRCESVQYSGIMLTNL